MGGKLTRHSPPTQGRYRCKSRILFDPPSIERDECDARNVFATPLSEHRHGRATTRLTVAGRWRVSGDSGWFAAMAATATYPAAAQQAFSGAVCQSPGNVQINDSPGPVQYTPQYPYAEGGYCGGYGSHAGGGGHGR